MTEHLGPVLDLIATVADVDPALDAIVTVHDMDLSPEDRRRADATVAALLDDPRFAERRPDLFPFVVHVPAAAERLAAIASDDTAPDQRDALAALAGQDPGAWADAYARWLLARDPAPAGPLATLPLDRTGITAADLTPLLGDEDTRLFAAITLAKVGSPDAVLDEIDAICRDQLPPLLWGNPFDAYDCLSEAQPMPAPVTTALLGRLPTGSHQADLVIWALTGVADAQGTLLLDRVEPAPPPPPTDPERAGEVADRLGREGLAATMDDLSPLRGAPPATAAGVVERLVVEAGALSDPVEAMMAGNALMRVVYALPSPIPLRIDHVVTHWHRHGVMPEDQLGAVLGLAGEERLLVAFHGALQTGDSTLARVLRIAQEVRGTTPMHGAGPGTPRRRVGMTSAAPPPRAEPMPEMTMAEPPEPPEPPATAPARRLRGQVTDADGTLRSHAFAPGVAHTLGLWVGPGGDGPLVASEPIDESVLVRDEAGNATLLVAVIGTEGVTRVEPQQQEIVLPATGSSKRRDFAVDVAADATRVTLNVVVYHQRKQIQTLDVVGPVAADDVAVGGVSIAFERRTESAPMPAADVDVSFTFHIGGAGEVLVHDGTLNKVNVANLDRFREQITSLLQQGLGGDDADAAGGTPGSKTQVALLRELAGIGNELWEMQLSTALGGERPGRAIQITTDGDDVVPLEFVYDYGVPTKDAKLCRHWREALATGRCTCKPGSGRKRTVCPLGFWGVRLVVERQTVTDLDDASSPGRIGPDRAVLRDVDRVLFAASKRIDAVSKNETETTTTLLKQLLADGFASATSWTGWTEQVASHRPGLLLTLPHNEQDEGVAALEIGAKSLRRIREITQEDVLPEGADIGPVVLLLGCDTANAPVSWQSAAAKFRALGAPVVVGTLVETLGRQTGPTARLFANALWSQDQDERVADATVGEVIRTVRRRLLLNGWTLGMSLVAYGDAEWRLRA